MTDIVPAYLVDLRDGVLTISFNRPEAGNALPAEAVPGLIELFRSIGSDRNIRAVLIRGEGKTFCAGGDVRGFAAALEQSVADRQADFHARLDRTSRLVEAYLAIAAPIVVACRGAVAGAGLLFVLGADIVLGDPSTVFSFAHQRIGLTPDAGVTMLLPRAVGARRAAELILTAARLGAEEACRIGIVSRLVAAPLLEQEAADQAGRLADAPTQVIRSTKALLALNAMTTLQVQLDAERDAIVACVARPAFAEGVRAFIEKRRPDFSGL